MNIGRKNLGRMRTFIAAARDAALHFSKTENG
jgi:hypothetical protein